MTKKEGKELATVKVYLNTGIIAGLIGVGFIASTSEDSEDEALPNPAQWLAMLGDENEVEDE